MTVLELLCIDVTHIFLICKARN